MDKTTPDFLTSWLGRWLGRIKPDGTRSHWMASAKRNSTGYRGVFYVERKGERILSIFYRKPGDRKQYLEKLGTSAQGWTAARAYFERTRRIIGQVLPIANGHKPWQKSHGTQNLGPLLRGFGSFTSRAKAIISK